MPAPKIDALSELYLPSVALGNGLYVKETMDFSLEEREFKDSDVVRGIIGHGLATTEAIELLTVTNYSPAIMNYVGPRHSPELIAMQPRWRRDEHRHGIALGQLARRLSIPSLFDTGELQPGLSTRQRAEYSAVGMLTRSSQRAANFATCVITFIGKINERQGGRDYKLRQKRLGEAGESDVADLFGAFARHEAIHETAYGDIFERYYAQLSEREKYLFLSIVPNGFTVVGQREVGKSRLGELLVEGGYDLGELARMLDEVGSKLVGETLTFTQRTLLACAEAWRADKKAGVLAPQNA